MKGVPDSQQQQQQQQQQQYFGNGLEYKKS